MRTKVVLSNILVPISKVFSSSNDSPFHSSVYALIMKISVMILSTGNWVYNLILSILTGFVWHVFESIGEDSGSKILLTKPVPASLLT